MPSVKATRKAHIQEVFLFLVKIKQMKLKYIMCTVVIFGVMFLVSCNAGGAEATTSTPAKTKDSQSNIQKNTNVQKTITAQKANSVKANSNAQRVEGTASVGNVNWLNVRDLEKAQKTDKRKVMVDLYTDWCGWCKRMDKATFQHDKIANVLNEKFHAVKFNAEDKEIINFKGKDHSFVKSGRKGYNQLAHGFANGRLSYPTIAFLDEDLNRINSFPGYKAPGQFDALLNYIADEQYKKGTSLAEFQRSFKSEIPATEGVPNRRKTVKPSNIKVRNK